MYLLYIICDEYIERCNILTKKKNRNKSLRWSNICDKESLITNPVLVFGYHDPLNNCTLNIEVQYMSFLTRVAHFDTPYFDPGAQLYPNAHINVSVLLCTTDKI